MSQNKSKVVMLAAVLIFALGATAVVTADAPVSGMSTLCGVWVNTAYNGDALPAVLIWTDGGTLTAWNESFDSACAGTSRCTVQDTWSDGGYAYFHVIATVAYLGGVELRTTCHLYRMSLDGNVLELLRASADALPRSTGVDPRDSAYRIYYRQRPNGITPDLGQVTTAGGA